MDQIDACISIKVWNIVANETNDKQISDWALLQKEAYTKLVKLLRKSIKKEEIAKKELEESPSDIQKLLLKTRQINKDNKKFWSNKEKTNES